MTSYNVFFSMSTGTKTTFIVPKGTIAGMISHVEYVGGKLGYTVEDRGENPNHWNKRNPAVLTDDELCRLVSDHNRDVRVFYYNLSKWTETPPTGDVEQMTPDDVQSFWHGLELLEVEPERWSKEYYVDRMEHLYSVMRGEESEGVSFGGVDKLTSAQAGAVVWLFDQYLDSNDMRLSVPVGRDYLASSYDGGYRWCEKCGPMAEDGDSPCVASCGDAECPIYKESGGNVFCPHANQWMYEDHDCVVEGCAPKLIPALTTRESVHAPFVDDEHLHRAVFAHLVLVSCARLSSPRLRRHRELIPKAIKQSRRRVRAIKRSKVTKLHVGDTTIATRCRSAASKNILKINVPRFWTLSIVFHAARVVWTSASKFENKQSFGTELADGQIAKAGRIAAKHAWKKVWIQGTNVLGSERMERIYRLARLVS